MALGASRRQVTGQVLAEGLRTGVLGALVGVVLAFASTRFLSALIVGISTVDPVTFTAVAVALLVVALLASYVPAKTASGIDPIRAIRADS